MIKKIQSFNDILMKAPRIIIAYSGGVDSHVLLHALSQANKEYRLNLLAVHIHHGLLEAADEWASHCEKICADLKIAYQCIRVNVMSAKGESVEKVARDARYQAFSELMQKNDLLMAAHHQEDQAETFLLQLFRGAGLKGLSSMGEYTEFSEGHLLRPFLAVSRDDILSYAHENNLSWVTDTSNHDTRFSRNFMRAQIIPLLRERWPEVDKTVMRTAKHAANANQLLDEIARDDFESVQGTDNNTLSVNQLTRLSLNRQNNVFRYWINQSGFLMPHEKHLDEIRKSLFDAREDANPCVTWRGAEVRRFQNNIYIMLPLQSFDSSISLLWNGRSVLQLPVDLGELQCDLQLGIGIDPELLKEHVEVRFRQGGESLRLPARQGTHSLKKLFQEWHVPVWMRDRIPLVFYRHELIAVVGYAVNSAYLVDKNKKGMVFISVR